MNGTASEVRQKTVRVIPPKVDPTLAKLRGEAEQLRTVAYCRVSTKQEEQLNSYDTQVKYYTEKINAEPKWKFAGIYADKGISGTSVKKRDEFNRMIRACKRGSVDLILTKSISRFARNTVDCLKYVRLLRDLNVDVYFEEQGIHSNQPGAEFYITIYGSLAQSESENISANVRWGKEQSAKQGKVIFQYQSLLGYRRGADGQPEIDEKEAETVRLIYRRYLMGDSLRGIADRLERQGVLSPKGNRHGTSAPSVPFSQTKNIRGMPFSTRPTPLIASARRYGRTTANDRCTMSNIIIPPLLTRIPSGGCRRNWRGAPENRKPSRSVRKPRWENTVPNTR